MLHGLIADFLKSRRPRELLAVTLASGLAAAALLGVGEAPLAARPTHAIAFFLVLAVVAFGLFLVRLAQGSIAGSADPAARKRAWIFGAAAVAFWAAFAAYGLGVYAPQTRDVCWAARRGPLAERRRLAAIGRARLGSAFSVLPELIGFRASEGCREADEDLSRIARGLCPFELDRLGIACKCAGAEVAADRVGSPACGHAQCQRGGTREELLCF